MSDQRNMIIAIALSVAVLLGFQYFYEAPRIAEETRRIEQQQSLEQPATSPGQEGTAVPQAGATGETGEVPRAQSQAGREDPSVPGGAAQARASALAEREAALGKVARARIDNGRITGSVPLVGRRIDDIVLTDYKETLADDSPFITLFSPSIVSCMCIR